MKRVVIVHGWDGSPNEPMHIWLASTLKDKGYEVIVPAMPAPETPVIENWIAKLKEVAPVDENTVLVGHSVGCQAVLRYTETFPEGTKVRGIVLVAPWMELDETTIEEEGEEIKEIAQTIKRDYSKGIVALIASTNNMQQADRLIKAIKSDTQTLCNAIRYCKSKKAKGKIAKILSERIEEIEDERILLTIAKEVREVPVEKLLVDKVESQQILAKIAKFAKNKRIKAMAKSKAKNNKSKTKEVKSSTQDFEYEMDDEGPKESGKGLVNKIIGLFHELIGF
jgi:predicted alpha/beta hydrolase family esterase